MFQDPGPMKVSTDVSSPRLVLPGAQSRPSGRNLKPQSTSSSFGQMYLFREGSTSLSLSLCLSAVGGLLQARFTSGFLSQRSDSPRPPLLPPPLARASPAAVEPPLHWAGPGPSSFLLPSRTPEPSVRTVGVRRLGGPVPLKESVTQGKVGTQSYIFMTHIRNNADKDSQERSKNTLKHLRTKRNTAVKVSVRFPAACQQLCVSAP